MVRQQPMRQRIRTGVILTNFLLFSIILDYFSPYVIIDRASQGTPALHGAVGIAVCWDVHRLWIIRELARAGAALILLPMDNDFNGTPRFPPFHAADAVFRAVENQLAFGLGMINGLSLVIDPYGRITAEGKVNERGVVVGETFTVADRTLYTRFGDWFGWLLAGALVLLVIRAWAIRPG